MSSAYEQLITHIKHTSLLSSVSSLLHWDQETTMPPGGVPHRAEQLALMAKLSHQAATDPRIADWLAECEQDQQLMADPVAEAAVNVRETRRGYDRATKLPGQLVAELASVTSQAQHAWADARETSDFKTFQPWLEKVVKLQREKAKCYGYADDGEPWDALAEDFEPGCTAKQVEAVFPPLRDELVKLLGEIMDNGKMAKGADEAIGFPIDQQEAFVKFVAEAIGFDFSRGLIARSAHPFSGGTHCDDVRMTTRFFADNFLPSLYATMHETGHSIYSQNQPGGEHIGTPMGEYVSLGIHESQSRLWENLVGRSRAFWQWCQPHLADYFGPAAGGLSVDRLYVASNVVRPSLIRVEADEVTYNLHVMVRFELERAILNGDLSAADLPGAWNEKYKQYLNIDVPDHASGCMQDVHWSAGLFGYFPTYTLGNLYAAQFYQAALAGCGDLPQQFARGEFTTLKDWLTRNIHSQGQRYRAADLCEKVTGNQLSAEPLLEYFQSKYSDIYSL